MRFVFKMKKGVANPKTILGATVLFLIFLAAAIFWTIYGSNFLVFGRPDIVMLNSPAIAVRDSSSGIYVVDSSRRRLLHIDASGKVDSLAYAEKGRFSEIYGLTVDAAGDIFILDVIRQSGTRRIQSEIVQKYSPDGRFIEEIFRISHHTPSFKRMIAGLARNSEGGCSFVTLKEERFALHFLRPGTSESVQTRFYDFPEAAETFNFFDVGAKGLVLFTTRRGEIYRADEQGVSQLFAAERNKGSVPWDAAVGDDAGFLFTDLGRRGIYSLDLNGGTGQVCHDPETIYYRISAKNGLVALSENELITMEGDTISVRDQFMATHNIVALRVCTWLAILVFLTVVLWILVLLMRFLIRKNNFVVRFSTAVIIGTLLITAVFCLIVTKNITSRMTREMQNRLTNVAELLAMQIPGQSFAELNSINDYMNQDYIAVKSLIESVIIQKDEYAGMYCVLYRIIDDAIAEVYESDNNHGIVNYPYDWPVEGSDEMKILDTGNPETYIYPSWVDGGVLFSLCPVYGDSGEPIGLIEIGTDLVSFRRDNWNLVLNLFLNVISMSVAMIIVIVELLVFIDARRKMVRPLAGMTAHTPVEMVRSAVFLVYFITNMSTSFLPLYARDMILAEGGTFPFPVEYMIAAPISADVLMGAIAALFGDRLLRKTGFRWMAIAGGILITAGICLEVAFYNIITLTAGFAVSGFGCGLLLFLANLKIAGIKDGAEKEKGFAGIAVAMNSGVNGGVVFGAFLINWLSQRAVLGMAVIVSLMLLLFSVRYMTKLEFPSLAWSRDKKEMSTLRFLSSPRTSLYLLALLGPAIASGYFLIYLFPIVGFDLGISESNIGYSFLLNSLLVIFFSSSLTNLFSRKFGRPASLALWLLIYAGSFGLFAFFQNIPALLSVLVLMGFADSFGQSLSTSYYTDLPEVVKYGHGRAIGLVNVVDNIFQTLGPFMFSYALHIGLRKGLYQIVIGLVILSLIFLLTAARTTDRQ